MVHCKKTKLLLLFSIKEQLNVDYIGLLLKTVG